MVEEWNKDIKSSTELYNNCINDVELSTKIISLTRKNEYTTATSFNHLSNHTI